MTRDDDTLARLQRLAVRQRIDLRERPERHVIGDRERRQRIARAGGYRHSAVPELDRSTSGNVNADWDRLAFRSGGRHGELQNLGDQLLVHGCYLVDIDVNDLIMV